MPAFRLGCFLDCLAGRHANNVFVLQIGAMDGRTSDPVHSHIKDHGWQGLLIEPLPHLFEQLQDTYRDCPQIRTIRTAITPQNGPVSLHYIPDSAVDDGNVPSWGRGAGSLYRDRNALDWPEIHPHVRSIEVPGTTLATLIRKQSITAIDVLQIDAEGGDYMVLRQLNFKKFRPRVINLEWINLPKAEQTGCRQILDRHGYLYAKTGYDLTAISPEMMRLFADFSGQSTLP